MAAGRNGGVALTQPSDSSALVFLVAFGGQPVTDGFFIVSELMKRTSGHLQAGFNGIRDH